MRELIDRLNDQKLIDAAVLEAAKKIPADYRTVGCFRAYLANAQTITGGTVTTVLFDAEDWDISGWHDITTNKGRFTPLLKGIYRISASLRFNTNFNDQIAIAAVLRKNGAGQEAVLDNHDTSGTEHGTPTRGGSVLVSMNGTTDYLELQVFHNDGLNNRTLLTGRDQTWWCGELVGPT